jgi:hypothetical protein
MYVREGLAISDVRLRYNRETSRPTKTFKISQMTKIYFKFDGFLYL